MKRMLFNATQQEELRVAIVDGQKLLDIDIETSGREQHKSNIYKAVITRIEPSLEACFVNYGEDRHGFLPFKEVVRGLFKQGVDVRNASIKDALAEGQEITVQVEKEERGNKGAALTTFISLAGRYLVLMPNNPRGGGVSRRVEGEERQELRENIEQLDLPPGMSVIARTAGIGRSVEELQWDLNYLLQLWNAIESAGKSAPGAFLIYHESSLVIRAIRDYFQPDIGEILVDTDEIYEQARQFMSHVMPDMVNRVKRYRDDIPLFSRFQIEHQIETAYSRVVPLPSGGSIVIDHTEALVSIDVNSARSTRGGDIETTAFNTNCEAAEEAARQLRLRDLGGLIVIDFIDMEVAKNKREIENRLKDALRHDRARVQMDKISRFGLVELSRQRLRPSLSEGSHITCPRCNGTGHIRDVDSFALQMMRIIEEESMKESTAAVHIQLPVDVAAFLLNEKRGEVLKIEARHHVSVTVVPNTHLETPRYKLERLKHDDPRLEDQNLSFELAEKPDTDLNYNKTHKEPPKPKQEAIVKSISPDVPPPAPPAAKTEPVSQEAGFWGKILSFFGIEQSEQEPPAPARQSRPARPRKNNDRNRNRNRGRRGRERTKDDEALDNTAAVEKTETVAAEAPAPRQPRQPKDGNGTERKRSRRNAGRQETKAAVDTESELVDENNVPILNETQEATVVEVTESRSQDAEEKPTAEDETRRRRRRGGRNRNRRDRDAIADSTEVAEIVSGEAREIDDMVDGFMDGSSTAQLRHASRNMPEVNDDEPVVVAFRPVSEVATPPQQTPPVAFYDPNDEAVTAEPAHEQQDQQAELPLELKIVREELVERPSEPTLPVSDVAADADDTLPVQQLEVSDFMTSPLVEEDEAVPATAAEGISETVVKVSVLEPEMEADEVIVVDEPVIDANTHIVTDQPEVSADMAEVETIEAVNTVSASPPEDLDQALASAGLVMAATDPEKMRLAREKAQQETEAPAPRPARRRRVPAPVADEPLVQVDTRNP